MNCIFCQIIKKEISSEIVYEDSKLIAFKDINPKAKIHLLIVPKKHLFSLNEVEEEDKDLLGELIYRAKKLAEDFKIAQTGYKLVFNCGKDGGQVVEHLHLHLLGGEPLKEFKV